MKSSQLLAVITAFGVATSLVSCEKKAPEQPPKPPAAPPISTTEPPKPADTAKTAAPAPAPAPTPAARPADIAGLKDSYGFASRLPMVVEGFSDNYRLHDLWVKLSGSKWAAKLLALPAVKETPQAQDMIQKWNTLPQAQMGKTMMEAFFGVEFVAVQPAGFTEKFLPWVDVLAEFQAMNFQRALMTGMSGGKPPDSAKLLREAAPEMIPALVKCEVPPLFFAFKAVKAKADIDGAVDQFLKTAAAQLPAGVELGQFKLDDRHDFRTITFTAKKFIAAFQEAKLQVQLTEMLGDEAKAKEAMTALLAKRAELAWGWVDDYLLISIGQDHNHLKFAPGDAGSALAIPVVARRAAQFLARRPMSLTYASGTMFAKLARPMDLSGPFHSLTEELRGIIKPEHIDAMRADVKRIEGRAKDIFTANYDPAVRVDFWEGGIHCETFGGARQKMFEPGKPLALAGLFSPTVFLLANSRANPATSAKIADLIEEVTGTGLGWYEKYGRTMVPEGERQGAATVEAIAIPMLKDLWRAGRVLGKALGDESAFVMDLSGAMPKLPGLPPVTADGKVPRLAWVWELKDRAAVGEAWKGFEKIIKQLAALVPPGAGAPPVPEAQVKKEGDVELHFMPLPIPTDDLLPHIAITKDRWMISSSPSFSKELASRPAATAGAPLGSEIRVQFPALCDLGDAWLKVVDKDPEGFFGNTRDAKQYDDKMRPLFASILTLMRCIRAFEWRMFDEESQTRNSIFLKLEDLP
jgi:hypothetical protein